MGAAELPVAEAQQQQEGFQESEREREGDGDGEEDKDSEKEPRHGAPQRHRMFQRLNPTNPLRIVIDGSRPAVPDPAAPPRPPLPRSAPTLETQPPPQPNSAAYTDRIWLSLFLLHAVIAAALVGFLIFKGVQGLLRADSGVHWKEKRLLEYFLPQLEAASVLSIIMAYSWQKAVRTWPVFMAHFILWSSFFTSLAAGVLLMCIQRPTTQLLGVAFLAFAIGEGLYACWVSSRLTFFARVLVRSLKPVAKFPDLNWSTYWLLGAGFLWKSVWILAVIGAMNFYAPPAVIIALVLSLAWTTEVMRNVANVTVSRVLSLFYLLGMQTSTKMGFVRAMSTNLGSACLGSLFVPSIEALRIIARALNLLEGEDEFMFSCAHCCLHIMQSIFTYGNGWAFVQVAAYGKPFVRASQDSWDLFTKREMVPVVDADITSALCFLTGVCSGATCVVMVAAWTAAVHRGFVATASLLAFFVGYLMTRIAMAVPQACVSCYYVFYAENPDNRLFENDRTIPERLDLMRTGRDAAVSTPRVPRRFRS